MKRKVNYVWLFILVNCVSACMEIYNPPELRSTDSYLVAEGFLNVSDRSCTIKLTRTLSISSKEEFQPATNAVVVVEGDDGRVIRLNPQPEAGVYSAQNILINPEAKYRLKIVDEENEYVSAFVDVVITPPIDELTWRIENDKVRFHVSTHNPNKGTRYYRWRYDETWQYTSAFLSYYEYRNGEIVERANPAEFNSCWKTTRSSDIHISSTASLSEDIVNDYFLKELPKASSQFSIRYSMLVEQHSIDKDEYEFWSQVKANVATSGSLFDVQPSRVRGNITAVNGDVPIIGYFSAHSVEQKRIFIRNNQLPVRIYEFESDYKHCAMDSLLVSDIPDFTGGKLIVGELTRSLPPTCDRCLPTVIFLGYIIASPFCVDCRVAGGVVTQPPFWE